MASPTDVGGNWVMVLSPYREERKDTLSTCERGMVSVLRYACYESVLLDIKLKLIFILNLKIMY